ncbi:hypothetical protein BROUX41_006512 [Berkeleyomyces rouxiae]|uniref:uncharacterized protein n=1 Tax=Berkeleyomyces rouxiae TaxID=2035830 RepID=UPI003B7D317E
MSNTDSNCANPLLLGWVKEWMETAQEHNSKGVTVYRNAYNSLKACPITFQHPNQLEQLRGFGPKLCSRLVEKLKEHCQANGLPMPRAFRKRVLGADTAGEDEPDVEAPKTKRQTTKRPYVPAYRSGAYAIIMALSSMGEDSGAAQGLVKQTVIELAQPHCDTSFKAPPDPKKFYTAWNSVKTLIEKDLVTDRGRPLRKYALTDLGWETARKLRSATAAAEEAQGPSRRGKSAKQRAASAFEEEVQNSNNDIAPKHAAHPPNEDIVGESATTVPQLTSWNLKNDVIALDDSDEDLDSVVIPQTAAIPSVVPLGPTRPARIPPDAFTVELVLDVREIRTTVDRTYMQHELANLGVTPIVRSLELGDAQWIAKCKDPQLLRRLGAEGDELILDWIVERKRLDDLITSIRHGRFQEQKFRLQRSGVQNVVYIVEEISLDSTYFQKYGEAVTSAMASLQVVNGYFLKRTRSMDETVRYLARMTKLLRKVYSQKRVNVVPSANLTAETFLPELERIRSADPAQGFYVSYEVFAGMSSKSDLLTLRDVFLKMLMNTRGVTAEKAIEIQKKWRTPYDFTKAYANCTTDTAKKDMVFQELSHLIGRKKVGKAASERLAEIWGM